MLWNEIIYEKNIKDITKSMISRDVRAIFGLTSKCLIKVYLNFFY